MVRPSGFEPPRGQPPLAPEASASAVSPRPHITKYNSKFTSGAEDRNRTGTVVSNRGILSPVRLPVPPPRQNAYMERVMGIEPT